MRFQWIVCWCLVLGLLACEQQPSSEDVSPGKDLTMQRESPPELAEHERTRLQQDYAATSFKVLRIGEQEYDGGPALAVSFTVPLDPQLSWTNYLKLTLNDGKPVNGDWILGERLNTLYFPFIEPETQYRVEVRAGLPAINGRLLEQSVSQQITTSPLKKQLRFISVGSQLSPQLSDGLTVEAINVKSVDIDFHRVSPAQLHKFVSNRLSDYYYDLQRLDSYASLVYSARYDLDYAANKKRQSLLPISQLKALQTPGVYIAVMKAAGDYPYDYEVTWFTVSDLGFQVRQYPHQMAAFVHQASSAKPATNVTVELVDNKGRVLASQATDSQGFTLFDQAYPDAVVAVARQANHLALVKLKRPALDLSEYDLPSRQQRPMELFLYGPRNLYRPGETVIIDGLLRDADGRLLPPQPVAVTVKKPDGKVHNTFVWQGDEQAYFHHEMVLSANVATGTWVLEAKLGNGDRFEYRFGVEDFLPERMKLTLTTSKPVVMADEQPEIEIQGDYLYGAPAAENRIGVTVTSQQARTLFEQWQDYVFGVDAYRDFDFVKEIPGLTLNKQGQLRLTLQNEWQATEQPLRITTRVSLFESGGRPVTRETSHIVFPRPTLVGIRPLWQGDIAPPNSDIDVAVISVNTAGELEAADQLDVLLVRENAQYYWQWDDGWSYQSSQRNVPVWNRVVSLSGDQPLSLKLPVDYGYYRLEIRNNKQQLVASYRFFAGWQWDRQVDGSGARPDQVSLAWDKAHYQAGETALLAIESPYDGIAIVTVEADRLLWHRQVTVTGNHAQVGIPIGPEWQRHDIYASVSVIRAGNAQRAHLPKRALGLLHLPLDRRSRQLEVALDVADKVLPKTTLVTRVKVSGAAPAGGASQTVWVTLAAVDTGVLSLTRFKTPDPHTWFFAPRSYQGEIRDTWGQLIEQLTTTAARQRFGGDMEPLQRGGEAPVSDVQVVALYSGKVAVDASGVAEIPLNLPYFNGELRLMAVAFSDQAYGHQEAQIKVAAPLIAQASTPRFLAYGDQSVATFELQNLTQSELELGIKASADEALGGQQLQQTVALLPQQKQLVRLPVSGYATSGAGQLMLSVQQLNSAPGVAAIQLTRTWQLGLRSPYPAETRQWHGVIEPGKFQVFPSDMSQGLATESQHLLLDVSSQPPLNASEYLRQLFQYPYGCLEQTTSRAWPLLMAEPSELSRFVLSASRSTLAASTNTGQQDEAVEQGRRKMIRDAISRIASMQRSDGSFGLWSDQSPENHWLTVYATDFLLKAKDQGYAVDQQLLTKAMQRLNRYVTTTSRLWSENSHYSSWPDHYHLSYRAYAALVLARRQQLKLGDLRQLYDRHHSAAQSPLPLAQLALALELTGDQPRAVRAWQQALAMSSRAEGYAGDYGSDIRDWTMTMVLATESRLVDDGLTGLYRLRDQLVRRRWLSTQEQVALYRLAKILSTLSTEPWQAQLVVDGLPEQVKASPSLHRHWQKESLPGLLGLKNAGSQPLFVDVQVQGFPVTQPQPLEQGIRVTRRFYNQQGQPVDLNRVTSGDLLLVQIQAQSTSETLIPEALVVDFLPAGFELENPNLVTSVKLSEFKLQNQPLDQWQAQTAVSHSEYRDDRYVAALPLSKHGISQLFYIVRAVTPGTYRLPPTQVEDMYRPDIRAIGQSEATVTIRPR